MNSTWVSAIASISASSLNSWHGVKRVRHSHSVQRARGDVIPTKRRYTRRGRAILPYGVSWDLGGTGVTENQFFERPILNSPYDYPSQHWELDATGQPTQVIVPSRRPADFVTPIPKPRRQRGQAQKGNLVLGNDGGTSPTVMVVKADGPYHKVEDVIAAAKAKPGSMNY